MNASTMSGDYIGLILRDLRIAEGLSQREMGLKLGVSSGTVSNYENQMVTPSERVIAKLLRYARSTQQPQIRERLDAYVNEVKGRW